MINDHRAFGGDRFLYGCATGFPDKQVILVHHARKLVRPPNDLQRMTIRGRFDFRPEFISAADSHGKIYAKFREQTHQFWRATLGSMNHVQNPPTGIGGRQRSIFSEVCKLRTDRESKYPDFFGGDAAAP